MQDPDAGSPLCPGVGARGHGAAGPGWVQGERMRPPQPWLGAPSYVARGRRGSGRGEAGTSSCTEPCRQPRQLSQRVQQGRVRAAGREHGQEPCSQHWHRVCRLNARPGANSETSRGLHPPGQTVTFPSSACGLSRGGEKSPAASRPRQAEHCAPLRCSPKDAINSPTALPCLLLPQLSRQPLPSLHPASPGAFRMPPYAVY